MGPGSWGAAEPRHVWTDGRGVQETAPTRRCWDLELGAGIWAGLEPGTQLRVQRGRPPAAVPRLDAGACSRRRVKSPLGWEMPPLDQCLHCGTLMQRVIKQLLPRAARLGWRQGLAMLGCRLLPSGVAAAGETPAQLLRGRLRAGPAAVRRWAAGEPAGAGSGAARAPASPVLGEVLTQSCLFI